MYAAVNGTRIYYEIIGKGRPLLMVHGNGEDHKIFDVAAGKLRERYKVYLVDLRGHGKSDKVSEYHYGDMAEDLNVFMRMLNMNDVIYYGYSEDHQTFRFQCQPEVQGTDQTLPFHDRLEIPLHKRSQAEDDDEGTGYRSDRPFPHQGKDHGAGRRKGPCPL